MSVVTDCVFVAEGKSDADEFKRIIRENGVYTDPDCVPDVIESHGPKVAGSYVFYMGINHASSDLYDALKSQAWKKTCILWWSPEYQNFPTVHTWNVKELTGTPWDYM